MFAFDAESNSSCVLWFRVTILTVIIYTALSAGVLRALHELWNIGKLAKPNNELNW